MALISRITDTPVINLDTRADLGRPPVVIEDCHQVPSLSAGAVSRPRLLTRLLRSQRTPIVLMVAPAGWGKTTLLAQWAHVDRRPAAWLTIEARHNDPAVLGREVACLLESLDPGRSPATAGSDGDGPTMSARPPVTRRGEHILVLDDVHRLHDPEALELLERIADDVPIGSQVVLSGRLAPWLRLGRRRVHRQLHELGPSDLAMTVTEASALLAAAGVVVPEIEIAELVGITEGWAAGLYLAALAHRERRDPRRAITALRGSDRAVAAFFREEVLVDLDDDVVRFLTRTCVLDRLSGPVCDAVLADAGSGRQLEAIVGAGNLFLVPLDRDQQHYRYHRLFAELLLLELRSREPELEVELHERAAQWFEAQQDLERAVSHARSAQALDRAGDLLLDRVLDLVGTANQPVLGRALDTFTPREVASTPALALTAAWHHLASGNARVVEHWLDHAESALRTHTHEDRDLLDYAVRLTRAWAGLERGDDQVLVDAISPDLAAHPWWSLACLVEGSNRVLIGRDDANELLRRAERSSAAMPAIHVQSLAYLALAQSDAGDWIEAGRLVERSRRVVESAGLQDFPPLACAYAVFATVLAFDGDRDGATEDIGNAERLLAGLGDLDPTTASLTGLLIGRAQQLSGDRSAARSTLSRTEAQLARHPLSRQAGLRARLSRQRAELDAAVPAGIDGRMLTPAERRVLEFLPTHLTMAEIAQRLYVSRNTVKSQAIAIYQKLGASSRGQAVERARQFGLLSD